MSDRLKSIKNIYELLDYNDGSRIITELDNRIVELCEYGEVLEKLSEPKKTFFFNQTLEREVKNSGFEQYFINTSGGFAHETVQALKRIGATSTAEILHLAINEFPNGVVPKNRAERVGMIKKIARAASEIWSQLDQRFYRYEDDLNSLNIAYVKSNKHLF